MPQNMAATACGARMAKASAKQHPARPAPWSAYGEGQATSAHAVYASDYAN